MDSKKTFETENDSFLENSKKSECIKNIEQSNQNVTNCLFKNKLVLGLIILSLVGIVIGLTIYFSFNNISENKNDYEYEYDYDYIDYDEMKIEDEKPHGVKLYSSGFTSGKKVQTLVPCEGTAIFKKKNGREKR